MLSTTTTGFTNSIFADRKNTRVSCIDLAKLGWNVCIHRLLWFRGPWDAHGDDNEVDPASHEDIIDDHMEDLLDDFEEAKCKKHIEKDLRK